MKHRIKTILVMMMACIMLGTCGFSVAHADYANTWTNTGDQRADIVGVALTQVGNTNDNHKYRSDDAAWCASFVVYCARQSGIGSEIIKDTGWAAADDLGVEYKGRPADRSSGINYTPRPGDLVFFDWASNGFCLKEPASFYGDHVGIVVAVSSDSITTVEGNSTGHMVRKNTYSLYDENIKGYGVPNYTKVSSSSTKTTAGYTTTISTMNNWLPFYAYLKEPTKMTCFDSYNGSSIGRIYENDRLKVTEVKMLLNGAKGLWCRAECPWDSGGTKIVYFPFSYLITGDAVCDVASANQQITTYTRPTMDCEYGYTGAGDDVLVVADDGLHYGIIYPLAAGGYKLGWIWK